MSTVRAAALAHFFEVAHAHGLNTIPLLRDAGLSRSMLEEPDRRIPAESAIRLLEAAAQASGDEQFGLRMAQSRELSELGVVSLLITHQPTLRAALRSMIDYRHLINDSLAVAMEDDGPLVIIRQDIATGSLARQANELAIGVLFRMCRGVLGEAWHPRSVDFAHAAPRDRSLHRRFFGCPLEFGADFNGLVCRAADLDAPNPSAAPALVRYAKGFVDTLAGQQDATLLHEVRKTVYLTLASGRADTGYVAAALGLSVRTMQRRLAQYDASFAQVLDEVRRELVQRYLQNPQVPMARIAQMLGYGSPSAFTRWFVAQFGMPPQRWRAGHRAAAGRAGGAGRPRELA